MFGFFSERSRTSRTLIEFVESQFRTVILALLEYDWITRTVNMTCIAITGPGAKFFKEQIRISEHQMLQHKVIARAKDITWKLAMKRRLDSLGIYTPVLEKTCPCRTRSRGKGIFQGPLSKPCPKRLRPTRAAHCSPGKVEMLFCGGFLGEVVDDDEMGNLG